MRKPGNRQNLKVRLHKGGVNLGSGGEGTITFSIQDIPSGVEFVEVTMTLADFGAFVGGNGYTDATAEVRGLDKLGKQWENKAEQIPTDYPTLTDEEALVQIAERAAAYEVDGWKIHEDLRRFNGHRLNDDRANRTYRVTFGRYVEVEES